MDKKLLLIVNPCSGKARMKTELLKVVRIFSDAGFSVTVYPTKERLDATRLIGTLTPGEFDRIVVCGGDGTLNEVITGLMQTNLRCTLGYVPAGTLNEWSAGLHISRNIAQAAKDIVSGEAIKLDIGQFDDGYFSYTASFGAFTSASYSAPQDMKNLLGQAAYFVEGIKSLGNIKPVRLRIVTEDRTVEGKYLFGAISNSLSVGGIVKYNEAKVKLNDGKFEILLVKDPGNLLKFQPIIDGILKQDFDREDLEFFTAESLEITGGEGMAWTLDGEYKKGGEKVVIRNIHDAIELIVPKESEKKDG